MSVVKNPAPNSVQKSKNSYCTDREYKNLLGHWAKLKHTQNLKWSFISGTRTIAKKNFPVPMADMSKKALYFSMQSCTANEPLRMVPGNLHISSHTLVMKERNFVIVTFIYIVCFFFYYQNPLCVFQLLPSQYLQVQSEQEYLLIGGLYGQQL